jgi:hypothetical protein
MHSWKSVLTFILLAYLVVASAISFTVQYLASAQPLSIGHQESSHTDISR